jgi:hypothetical protein
MRLTNCILSCALSLSIFGSVSASLAQPVVTTPINSYSQSKNPQQDVVFSPKGGRFSIILPLGFTDPIKVTRSISTPFGDTTLTAYIIEGPLGMCAIGYFDIPKKFLKEERSIEQMFDRAQESAAIRSDTKVDKQESYLFQGNPARSVYISSSDPNNPLYGRFDYILVEQRLYQVGFGVLNKTDLNGPDAQKYFKSFQIKK